MYIEVGKWEAPFMSVYLEKDSASRSAGKRLYVGRTLTFMIFIICMICIKLFDMFSKT